MTSKERMIIAMKNGRPDRVPVAPDMSNMIPCRLTGKPFWDIYLYKNPPLWKAYIDAVRHFGFDGWLTDDADIHAAFDEKSGDDAEGGTVIVARDEQRIVNRSYTWRAGERQWSKLVTAYERDNAPTLTLARTLGLGETSDQFEPIVGVKKQKTGAELLNEAMDYMGDDGVGGSISSRRISAGRKSTPTPSMTTWTVQMRSESGPGNCTKGPCGSLNVFFH